jgi:hypothetical protein
MSITGPVKLSRQHFQFYLFMHYDALTHKPRPYCDLKTSKIAFFFRKSLVFFQTSLADGPGLCSLVFCTFFSMSSIRPSYVHGVSTATVLRPQGDPTAINGDPAATVLCTLRPYGDSTTTIAFVRPLSCESSTILLRSCYVYKNNTFCAPTIVAGI